MTSHPRPACGGCAARRAARQAARQPVEYVWTSGDGTEEVIYPELIQAKAKVLRKGGSYKPRPVGV